LETRCRWRNWRYMWCLIGNRLPVVQPVP